MRNKICFFKCGQPPLSNCSRDMQIWKVCWYQEKERPISTKQEFVWTKNLCSASYLILSYNSMSNVKNIMQFGVILKSVSEKYKISGKLPKWPKNKGFPKKQQTWINCYLIGSNTMWNLKKSDEVIWIYNGKRLENSQSQENCKK